MNAQQLPTLRIAFVDFPRCDSKDNIFIRILSRHYHVEIDEEKPDILFYSSFGLRHLLYKDSIRIFYTIENVAPDFNICDFAISSCRMNFGKRHLYLPCCIGISFDDELPPLPSLNPEMAHRRFCSFLYSNSMMGRGTRLRDAFCRLLMEYDHVDCPGTVLHNIDIPELAARNDASNWHASKVKYLSQYKFNIAFENSDTSGYITEKLTDAFFGNTIPIYWGSEGDVTPFPREAMIVANDFSTLDELVARVREINEDDELYMRMLAANPLRHGMTFNPEAHLEEFILSCLRLRSFDKDPHRYSDVEQIFKWISFAGKRRLKWLEKLTKCAASLTFGRTRRRLRRVQYVLEKLRTTLLPK